MNNKLSIQEKYNLNDDLANLVEAVTKAISRTYDLQEEKEAKIIRDQLCTLPNSIVTEVLNAVMMELLEINPAICRWFIVEIFLYKAAPEAKADVAERMNLLIADLLAL